MLHLYATVTGWLFEHLIQPPFYALGLMAYAEDAYGFLDAFLLGALGIGLVWLICRPLEIWRPVEPVLDRRVVRTDILYTLLNRLGILPILAFVALLSVQPLWQGFLTEQELLPPTLEALFPTLLDRPWLAFAAYVVVLDFAEYWRHRAQHGIRWWWSLHAVHHAQRQMTFWSDDRNHLLDDVIAALWFGAIALLIGVPPGQFPLIVLLLRCAESLSHANVRLDYGWLGERLLVSPRFHRLHHGLLSAGAMGKNYAVLLPVWDWVFGTADFNRASYPATGAPEEPEALATGGWWRQQVVAARRMLGQPTPA